MQIYQRLFHTAAACLSFGATAACALDIATYAPGAKIENTQEARALLNAYDTRQTQPWIEPSASAIPSGEQGELIRYGIDLLTDTSRRIGPLVADKSMRHSRNNLNCVSCHQAGPSGLPGTKQYSLPFVNVVNDYPKLDIKNMKITSLEMRIAGMLGAGESPIKPDSREMQAMVAYMAWLGSQAKAGMQMQGTGLKENLKMPARAADPVRGGKLYDAKCASCHGPAGLGIKNADFATSGGYQFPPIAGDDTYDDGGHMYMVPLMTRFLYVNMPLGATAKQPQLTVQDAYDIAAYVNSDLPRRHNPGRIHAYPDPAFRPKGFAIHEHYPNSAAYRRARFGPNGEFPQKRLRGSGP